MSYTKGPWRVSKGKARRVTNEHGVIICTAVLRNQGGPKQKAILKDEHEAEANADLIAAAPELLAVAQYAEAILVDVFEGKTDPVAALDAISDLARPAIAKATGAGA